MSAGYLALGMALLSGPALGASSCEARSGAGTGALLELYTSEGCSSCPPADRWFGALSTKADPRTLSLLAFHVDYWDEIGWPDRFAQHAFTLRQSQRVRARGSKTVYTPQVMLSSRLDLRWFKPEQVDEALAQLRRKPAQVALHLKAQALPRQWQVDLTASSLDGPKGSLRMYLAMYENSLSSVVKAGENKGVTLHHERVVRGLWGPWPLSASGAARQLKVTPPGDAKFSQLGFTAFVQDESTGETMQALSLPLGKCGMAEEISAAP